MCRKCKKTNHLTIKFNRSFFEEENCESVGEGSTSNNSEIKNIYQNVQISTI